METVILRSVCNHQILHQTLMTTELEKLRSQIEQMQGFIGVSTHLPCCRARVAECQGALRGNPGLAKECNCGRDALLLIEISTETQMDMVI